jgi:hypothetical protein
VALDKVDNACGQPDCLSHIDEALAHEDGYQRLGAALYVALAADPTLVCPDPAAHEGVTFTTDSLAAAICNSGEVYADCRHRENEDDVAAGLPLVRVTKDCEPAYHRDRAAAIIQAAKEAERE